jgi:RNA polymerase sigma-70 factor (ECF subfamily)
MTLDHQEIPDEDLVQRAVAAGDGDLRAFDQLVDRHKGRVLANCRYLTRSSEDSEDLAQEVFLKAFFALPRFEGRSAFKTWIHRIKINHCLNYLEKKKGKEFIDIDEPGLSQHESMSVAPRAHSRAEAASDRERIAWVLDHMTETLRVPLIMRDADGFSYQEIAEQLGVGLSAVKMRIKRGREEFRQSWIGAFGDLSDTSRSPLEP